ncbi:MAG: peroxiredoxin family protein [Planctomycetota bacterium]|jgi:peroxiredoxin
MSEDTKQKGLFLAVVVSTLILLAVVIWAGIKRSDSQQAMTDPHYGHDHENTADQGETAMIQHFQDAFNPAENLTIKQVEEMAQKSRMWGASYNDWYGKQAPDFTLTDLNGKEHRLSDYKGKEVILVFWATWCGPCRVEIPHLIELRKSMSKENLAILAISNEQENVVKNFVSNNNLNYTVLVSKAALAAPYSHVNAIPSSFFVSPDGKIKFGTVGTIDLDAMKAIIQAGE